MRRQGFNNASCPLFGQEDICTVSLLLQRGVLSEDNRLLLWEKASLKSAYYPGFLITAADDLPHKVDKHESYADLSLHLAELIEQGNSVAQCYLWCHSENGQSFFHIIKLALKRPSQQDVVVTLFNAIGQKFDSLGLSRSFRSIEDLQMFNSEVFDGDSSEEFSHLTDEVREINTLFPDSKDRVLAMLGLAQMSETLLDPLFGGAECPGSVMRKRIKPVSEPLLGMVAKLEEK